MIAQFPLFYFSVFYLFGPVFFWKNHSLGSVSFLSYFLYYLCPKVFPPFYILHYAQMTWMLDYYVIFLSYPNHTFESKMGLFLLCKMLNASNLNVCWTLIPAYHMLKQQHILDKPQCLCYSIEFCGKFLYNVDWGVDSQVVSHTWVT